LSTCFRAERARKEVNPLSSQRKRTEKESLFAIVCLLSVVRHFEIIIEGTRMNMSWSKRMPILQKHISVSGVKVLQGLATDSSDAKRLLDIVCATGFLPTDSESKLAGATKEVNARSGHRPINTQEMRALALIEHNRPNLRALKYSRTTPPNIEQPVMVRRHHAPSFAVGVGVDVDAAAATA